MSSFSVVVVYCYLMMKFYLFSSEKMFWIKWLLSWKLLKQLFIIWLISCFTLLGSSFVNAWYTRQIWSYSSNGYLPSIDIAFLRTWNPLSLSAWYSKQLFYLWWAGSPNSNSYWFWHNWLPYIYIRWWEAQWHISRYYICDEIIDSSSTSYPSHCNEVQVWDSTSSVFANFISSLTNSDYYYYSYSNSYSDYPVSFCFSSSYYHSSICINEMRRNNYFTDSLWLPSKLTFDNINTSILWNPPSSSSSWGWNYENNNGWIDLFTPSSALNYYETRYWFNKNICYVGVDSMNYIWGDSVSFNEGAWLTIFEAFNSLYWNTDLDKVYVWINNWILNYEQRFWNDWNPMYLSNYNSWTNQVDIYYDNLSFPFAWNPVAVYFMSDYIEQVAWNSLYDPSWSAVVSYCNLKINDWTFEQIIDQSDKTNITKYTENFNINKWLNADWTEKDYWVWLSSWVELAFSWDTSLKNSLKEFLDETENNISSLKDISDSIVWHILPVWIITPFVFFALFRFIRKH